MSHRAARRDKTKLIILHALLSPGTGKWFKRFGGLVIKSFKKTVAIASVILIYRDFFLTNELIIDFSL